MFDLSSITDLSSIEAKLYMGGSCSKDGVCAGFSAVVPIEFFHTVLYDDRSGCLIQLYLNGLIVQQVHWLVFSSEFFYPKPLELTWPLPDPDAVTCISMVERVRPGCLRAALTLGAMPAIVNFHVMDIPLPGKLNGRGWDEVAAAHHLYFSNKGPCWGGVSLLTNGIQSSFCLETILFDSLTLLGRYPIAVHLYSDGNDVCFGDRVVDIAVEIYNDEGLITRETPELSIVSAAQAWYVGDVVKSTTGFQFEARGLPMGSQVEPPFCVASPALEGPNQGAPARLCAPVCTPALTKKVSGETLA
jgi:hypothetical protein